MTPVWLAKIAPQLDMQAANKMQKQLVTRFGRVAKKFGSAMRNVAGKLKGVLAGALAAGLGAALNNPIEELNAKIDALLKKGQSISARAKQIGVSSGELFQASQVARAAGIEDEDLQAMLTALQVKLGEAKSGEDMLLADKGFLQEQSLVKNFFNVLRSLREAPDRDVAMKQAAQIFGEGDVIKLAALMQMDPDAIMRKMFKGRSVEETTRAVERYEKLNADKALVELTRDTRDFFESGKKINARLLGVRAKIEDEEQRQEQAKLGSYETFVNLQKSTQETNAILTSMQEELTPYLNKATTFMSEKYGEFLNYLKRGKKRVGE